MFIKEIFLQINMIFNVCICQSELHSRLTGIRNHTFNSLGNLRQKSCARCQPESLYLSG